MDQSNDHQNGVDHQQEKSIANGSNIDSEGAVQVQNGRIEFKILAL